MKQNRLSFYPWITGLVCAALLQMMIPPAKAELADTPWPMYQHDLRRTGQSLLDGPSTTAVKVKWTYTAVTRIKTSPTIGPDGTIYIGAGFAPLCAIDPDTGDEKWCTTGGGDAFISSPTIGTDPDGTTTVYMGARDNKLWAVKPDGSPLGYSIKWRYKIFLDGDIFSSPAIDPVDDTVYMACGCLSAGIVYALDPEPPTSAGLLQWKLKIGKSARASSPAIDTTGGPYDGTIYIGSTDGKLHALRPRPSTAPTGDRKWVVTVGPKNRHSSPAVGDDGTIYIGSYTGVAAVRPQDGAMLPGWPFPTEGKVEAGPVIARDGTIYAGTSKGVFYAINPNGSQKWKVQGLGAFLLAPAIGNNGIIYAAGGRTVYALNPANGSILWRYKTGDRIKWSAPAIGANKTLYIGSGDHNLYAFEEG